MAWHSIGIGVTDIYRNSSPWNTNLKHCQHNTTQTHNLTATPTRSSLSYLSSSQHPPPLLNPLYLKPPSTAPHTPTYLPHTPFLTFFLTTNQPTTITTITTSHLSPTTSFHHTTPHHTTNSPSPSLPLHFPSIFLPPPNHKPFHQTPQPHGRPPLPPHLLPLLPLLPHPYHQHPQISHQPLSQQQQQQRRGLSAARESIRTAHSITKSNPPIDIDVRALGEGWVWKNGSWKWWMNEWGWWRRERED